MSLFSQSSFSSLSDRSLSRTSILVSAPTQASNTLIRDSEACPVGQLPPEILAVIFTIVVQAEFRTQNDVFHHVALQMRVHDHGDLTGLGRDSVPCFSQGLQLGPSSHNINHNCATVGGGVARALTQVCTFWREVARSLPHLWNLITIMPCRYGPPLLLEDQLNLSRDLPLSIRFYAGSGTMYTESYANLITARALRWGDVSFCVPAENIHSLLIGFEHTRVIDRAVLAITHDNKFTQVLQLPHLFPAPTGIREFFVLDYIPTQVVFTTPPQRLTTLIFRAPPDLLLETLRQACGVVKLSLDIQAGPPPPFIPIEMPFLQELSINTGYRELASQTQGLLYPLDYISAPNLTVLEWIPFDWAEPENKPHLVAIDDHPWEAEMQSIASLCLIADEIERLTLPYCAFQGDVGVVQRYLLTTFPRVEVLEIRPSPHMLDIGCLKPLMLGAEIPLPILRSLKITCESPNNTDEALTQLLTLAHERFMVS